MPLQQWPEAGQRVDVHAQPACLDLVAVVDDVREPEQLHLREPVCTDGSPGPTLPIGTSLQLTWTSRSGFHGLRTTLVSLPEARVRLWKLEPAEPPVVLQRREYVRVPETMRVDLLRGEDRWKAGLSDLSEGGARVVLLESSDLTTDDRVELLLEIEQQAVRLRGQVLAVERTTDGRLSSRVRFEPLGPAANVVRRRILEQQRRALTAGLR